MNKNEKALKKILITSYKDQFVPLMQAHPELFEVAIELSLTDEKPYCWRSAYLLSSCMKENDSRLKKHINRIISSIETKDDGHQREFIKILLNMKLTEKHEGFLFNICLNIWEKIHKQPSVRYTAFRMILQIAKKHPELNNEIVYLTQDQYLETLSPGVKNAIQIMAREFSQKD